MISPALYSSASDEWSTPPDFFAKVEAEFGPFDLDPCATAENAKAPKFYTREQDGLAQPWFGKVWLNPPYGRGIGKWIEKAHSAVTAGDAELVAALVPARVDTAWWHSWIWNLGENRPWPEVTVAFIRGRLRFGGAKNSAPFPSALVVFRRTTQQESTS